MNTPEADPESSVRTVEAQINYLLPGPPINRRFVSAGVEVNTGRYGPFTVQIRDGRTIKEHFRLATHGFQLTLHSSAIRDFYDRNEVDRSYAAEVSEAVKALTGASFVAVTGWMIRNSGDLSRFQRGTGPYAGGTFPT